MRLAIGEGDPQSYTLVKYVRYPNRLSQGMFSDGMLKRHAIERTLEAFDDVRSIIGGYHIDTLRVVSTSVLRTAKNARQFVDLVRQKTGFHVEIIAGTDEAMLIHTGAVNGIDVAGRLAFVVDIGGGSTELSVGDRESIQVALAVETGAVRLREAFLHHDPPTRRELAAVVSSVEGDFKDTFVKIRTLRPDIQIGVPGNIGTIYNMLKPSDGLALEDLRTFYGKLSAMTIGQIRSLTSLEEDKADILLPGLMILLRIMESLGMGRCYLSSKGLLHGMLISLLGGRRIDFSDKRLKFFKSEN